MGCYFSRARLSLMYRPINQRFHGTLREAFTSGLGKVHCALGAHYPWHHRHGSSHHVRQLFFSQSAEENTNDRIVNHGSASTNGTRCRVQGRTLPTAFVTCAFFCMAFVHPLSHCPESRFVVIASAEVAAYLYSAGREILFKVRPLPVGQLVPR